MDIWSSMPTLKPNPSRVILAWHRQKTDVVLSKESNETAATTIINKETTPNIVKLSATPATTWVSTFSKTVEAYPITVSLDLASILTTHQSNSISSTTTTTTTTGPLSTMKPVDRTTSERPSVIVNSSSPAPSKQNSSSTTLKPTRKPLTTASMRPGLSTRAPAAEKPDSVDDWINQIHGPLTPRPYVAERDCGIRSIVGGREGRVVGGRDSQVGEFPWSVLIRETTLLGFFVKTKCGGALIDLKWVLTAAHCKPGMFGSLEVVVGENDLAPHQQQGRTTAAAATTTKRLLKPIVRKVKRMIIHRDYNPSNFDNDIALLELESPYQIQPHVVPICLPEKEESFIGQQAMVAGWGKLSFGGPIPKVLQVAKLPVIGNKQCQEMYHNSGHVKIISDSFLCAGYASGGQDSCEGDSGGPLQLQRPDGRWVLAGTVSHGIKCAEPNLPGIYIRIGAYLPWIKAVTYQQDHNKRYGYRRHQSSGFTRTGSIQLL